MKRTVKNANELFDILSNIRNTAFVTFGYVTGVNLAYPTEKRMNPETKRMKGFPDYTALGREIGFDRPVGAIIKLKSYNLPWFTSERYAKNYADHKAAIDATREKYGLAKTGSADGHTKTVEYGKNGIELYSGDNKDKEMNSYMPKQNIAQANTVTTYYAIDTDGNIMCPINRESFNKLFKKGRTALESAISEFQKAGADESRVEEYIKDMAEHNGKFATGKFETNSIVYIVATVDGEKITYINPNINRAVNGVNVNGQDLAKLVREKYHEDFSGLDECLRREGMLDESFLGVSSERVSWIVNESVAHVLNEKRYHVNMDIPVRDGGRKGVHMPDKEFEALIKDFDREWVYNEVKKKVKDIDSENLDLRGSVKNTSSGVTYRIGYIGGDWQQPVCFMLYSDGDSLRVYVPRKGNAYNLHTGTAFSGSENDEDIKYIAKEWGCDEDECRRKYGSIAYNEKACVEDFASRVEIKR